MSAKTSLANNRSTLVAYTLPSARFFNSFKFFRMDLSSPSMTVVSRSRNRYIGSFIESPDLSNLGSSEGSILSYRYTLSKTSCNH